MAATSVDNGVALLETGGGPENACAALTGSACAVWNQVTSPPRRIWARPGGRRSEEHTSELQSHLNLVCRLLLEKKKRKSIVRWSRRMHTLFRGPQPAR